VARLRLGGFTLLDTQFVTAHLTQFGACEVPRDTYKTLLEEAARQPATWIADTETGRISAEIEALRPRETLG
jgi:leucyl/phenylalanyl-tRNA--protein transferase